MNYASPFELITSDIDQGSTANNSVLPSFIKLYRVAYIVIWIIFFLSGILNQVLIRAIKLIRFNWPKKKCTDPSNILTIFFLEKKIVKVQRRVCRPNTPTNCRSFFLLFREKKNFVLFGKKKLILSTIPAKLSNYQIVWTGHLRPPEKKIGGHFLFFFNIFLLLRWGWSNWLKKRETSFIGRKAAALIIIYYFFTNLFNSTSPHCCCSAFGERFGFHLFFSTMQFLIENPFFFLFRQVFFHWILFFFLYWILERKILERYSKDTQKILERNR